MDFDPCRGRVDPERGPWVALVGAGPGDPELLTRRGATLLGVADVVLHDRLCGREVLRMARPGATLVDVGKAKGCGASQRGIECSILANHAAGRRVVRLKGGDPFVFGRGMEEVRAARAAGCDVEVVPGVSAAFAAPALAGIAVTERGVSASVTVVSGHRAGRDNDWTALAAIGGTLVVLMVASTAGAVATALLAGGMPGTTPVAVVVDASGPHQTVGRGDLAGLARADAPLPGPCVLVVGDVAATSAACSIAAEACVP